MAVPTWPDRLFRLLLRFFPAEFRREFGSNMAADFEDQRAMARRQGALATLRVWLRTSVDLFRRGPQEHLDVMQRDLRRALRVLRCRPALALTTFLTLTLAIGLNTAAFSVVNAVLIEQLPAPESHQLVRLYQVDPPPELEATRVAPGIFLDWSSRVRALQAITFIASPPRGWDTLIDGGYPEELGAKGVSHRFFEVAGIAPALGRSFVASDYAFEPGASPQVVILSHDLWTRRFGGRKDVVGSTIRFAPGPVTVIGVMPPGFFLGRLPDWAPVDCWMPYIPDPRQRRLQLGDVLGRLAPGATLAAAQRELDGVTELIEGEYPQDNRGRLARVSPLLGSIVSGVRSQLWALSAAAGCILLIGCANITCLLLADASGRRRELATRLALGASRVRIARELMTESFILSLGGGIGAGVLAWWAVPALVHWMPAGLPRAAEIAVDARVWAFALALATAVGIGCGLAGTLSVRHLQSRLTAREPVGVASARTQGVKQGLIIGNVALALVLVAVASLLVRTMQAVNALELGFVPEQIISVGLNPNIRQPQERLLRFDAELIERVRALPGVVAAGIGSRPLMSSGGLGTAIILPLRPHSEIRLQADIVSDGYLDTLGGHLLEGRAFDSGDHTDGPRVALLNQAAARQLFGGDPAVGQTLLVGKTPTTVVGVVADVRRTDLERDPEPTVYFPSDQVRSRTNNLLIRTAGDPAAVVPAIRAILHELDPMQALSRIHVLDELLDQTKAPRRFAMQLVGAFSLLALLLAMVGLYGVVAESVQRRTPEIGIRMALGATAAGVARMVLARTGLMVMTGLAIGLAASVALKHLVAGFVFGVEPGDPLSYAAACGVLLAGALCASFIPARRAAAVDPLQALRRE
jgi:putative ABC transport system permease protein